MTAMVFGAALVTAGQAWAAPILIQFKAFNPGSTSTYTPVGGTTSWYNNYGSTTSNDPGPAGAFVMKDSNNVATDVSLSAPSFFGFLSSTKGNKTDFTFNGFTFAGGVMDDYIADNNSSVRDGLIKLHFSSPTPYTYEFTAVASNHGDNPDGPTPSANIAEGGSQTLFNIGGTYAKVGTTQAGSFTGGTTVAIDPALGTVDQAGAVLSGQSHFDATENAYVIDFNVGMGSGLAMISAMKVDISPVPEPATFGLLAIGSLALLRRRRHVTA
jgi:hypothetical protein